MGVCTLTWAWARTGHAHVCLCFGVVGRVGGRPGNCTQVIWDLEPWRKKGKWKPGVRDLLELNLAEPPGRQMKQRLGDFVIMIFRRFSCL